MRRAALESVAGGPCVHWGTLKSPKSLARAELAATPGAATVSGIRDGPTCPGRYCTSTAGRWEVLLFTGILQVPTGFVLFSAGEGNTDPLA